MQCTAKAYVHMEQGCFGVQVNRPRACELSNPVNSYNIVFSEAGGFGLYLPFVSRLSCLLISAAESAAPVVT